MKTGKYVSSERIIEKVYRDHGFTDELEFSDAIEWIGDAIGLMGSNAMFDDAVCTADVEDYRASLPSDMTRIQLITRKVGSRIFPLRYDGDPNMIGMHCSGSANLTCQCDDTYRINKGFVFTSFETGTIQFAYESFPVDDNGFPLIQDEPAAIEAMAWYIAFKLAYKMFIGGRMPRPTFDYIRSEKDWYVGKAISKAKGLSLDQVESLKNQTVRIIPKTNAHGTQFGNIGMQERRINHNTSNTNNFDQRNTRY
jgi:hypothetical protein